VEEEDVGIDGRPLHIGSRGRAETQDVYSRANVTGAGARSNVALRRKSGVGKIGARLAAANRRRAGTSKPGAARAGSPALRR